MHRYICHFNDAILMAIFQVNLGSSGLARSCRFGCQCPVVLVLIILTGQARTLHTHVVLRLYPADLQ